MDMDDNAQRLAALELLMMERLALDGPGQLVQLAEAVRPKKGQSGEDALVRARAFQLIEESVRRHDQFSIGLMFTKQA